MVLTKSECILISKLLELASDKFSNFSCNDFDFTFIPVEDRKIIMEKIMIWNGTPEDYDPNDDYEIVFDWLLMTYFSEVLKLMFYI